MSFIKNEFICPVCRKTVKYYWILPDGIMLRYPDSSKYICANHYLNGNEYIVSPRCGNCGNRELFHYSKEGEFIC